MFWLIFNSQIDYESTQERFLSKLDDNTDIIVLCIMSHGMMEDGVHKVLFSCGTKVPFADLISPILSSSKLSGKPKVIIAQVCRGRENESQGLQTLEPDG